MFKLLNLLIISACRDITPDCAGKESLCKMNEYVSIMKQVNTFLHILHQHFYFSTALGLVLFARDLGEIKVFIQERKPWNKYVITNVQKLTNENDYNFVVMESLLEPSEKSNTRSSAGRSSGFVSFRLQFFQLPWKNQTSLLFLFRFESPLLFSFLGRGHQFLISDWEKSLSDSTSNCVCDGHYEYDRWWVGT